MAVAIFVWNLSFSANSTVADAVDNDLTRTGTIASIGYESDYLTVVVDGKPYDVHYFKPRSTAAPSGNCGAPGACTM